MIKFNKKIAIGSRLISPESPVFIIAEAGVNHDGDMMKAKKLIDVASEAGVDAVKFQSFHTESLILKNVEKARYQIENTGANESQFEMLKKLELDIHKMKEIFDYAKQKQVICLTTPFDETSLEQLNNLNLPAYKIASTDTTNLPFLIKAAKKGKPLILSTGMTYMAEIEQVLSELHPLNQDIILLQCAANYPLEDKDANLNVIRTFQSKFDAILGYSDHTTGFGASPYSVAMGAKVVEKHFTLEKEADGPDHKASLSPGELKKYVLEIRKVEAFLGSFIKKPSFAELSTRKSLQKCLVASKAIAKGQIITEDMMIAKRTGGIGISPLYFRDITGKKASKNYEQDDIINE